MKYTELLCKFNSDELSSDIIIAYLSEFPFESFYEEENSLKAYINIDEFDFEIIENSFKEKGLNVYLSYKTIEQINWNAKWESDYQPVIIDNKCIVRTSFHKKPENIVYDILIEPKMSFGTGHHETTYLMLESMLEMNFKDQDVLDMGCGTAVLAILASKMGAKSVLAIDNDDWTYENIIENIKLNIINNIGVQIGDVDLLADKKFNTIIANINRNVLIEHIKNYATSLNSDGLMLLSGFYENDIEAIQNEANQYGFQYIRHSEKNHWVAVLFKKI